MINIIVAIAKNNAIGKDNQLLWHLSEDLKYFKRITANYPVIMGENTWFSLPKRPLPNRENIVISHKPDFSLPDAKVFHNIEDTLEYIRPLEQSFIIGGAMLYRTMLPFCDRLFITKVDKEFDADTFFPEIDEDIWLLESESEMFSDTKEELEYRFLIYKRR